MLMNFILPGIATFVEGANILYIGIYLWICCRLSSWTITNFLRIHFQHSRHKRDVYIYIWKGLKYLNNWYVEPMLHIFCQQKEEKKNFVSLLLMDASKRSEASVSIVRFTFSSLHKMNLRDGHLNVTTIIC